MAKKSKKKKKAQKHHHFIAQSNTALSDETAQVMEQKSDVQDSNNKIRNESHDEPKAVAKQAGQKDEFAKQTQVMIRETRATLILAGSIIAVLFVLWFVFEHTALGPQVYNLIRL